MFPDGLLARYLRQRRPSAVIASVWPLTVLSIVALKLAGSKARLAVCDHNPLSLQYGCLALPKHWVFKKKHLADLSTCRRVDRRNFRGGGRSGRIGAACREIHQRCSQFDPPPAGEAQLTSPPLKRRRRTALAAKSSRASLSPTLRRSAGSNIAFNGDFVWLAKPLGKRLLASTKSARRIPRRRLACYFGKLPR